MPIRAIIIDDELRGIEALRILIQSHVKDVKIVAETTDAEKAIELIEDYMPEIVFLDIHMPAMDGFELLEKLKWKEFHLIFTTAHPQHALRAIKSEAVDYLLKPVDPEELKFAVNKVRGNMDNRYFLTSYSLLKESGNHQQKQKLLINSKYGVESVDPAEILYLESSSNYTRIILTESREILCSKTLKEFHLILCNENSSFMRVHNSFIINLHRILRYLKGAEHIIMCNSQTIPIAKSKKEAFLRWLNN